MRASSPGLVLALIVPLMAASCGDDSSPADAGDTGVPDGAPDAAPPDNSILDQLLAIPGMLEVDELTTPEDGYVFYRMLYQQPVDHGAAGGAAFGQRITLLHRDTSAPVVLETAGHENRESRSLSELAALLGANELVVEHRFFGESVPAPAIWENLTIEQAAADHHRIVEALEPIYGGSWISSGAGKGGMAALSHRRFYPGDVDGTVAYVAQSSLGAPDPRYIPFFDTVGEETCRQRVRSFQRDVLSRGATLVPMMSAWAEQQTPPVEFDRVGGVHRALEASISEFEWLFWQYGSLQLCTLLPVATDSDATVLDFLAQVGTLSYYSDREIEPLQPYYYQAQTELGYPGLPTAHLADWLVFPFPTEELLPPDVRGASFDRSVMMDIAGWVQSEGSEIILIYGENDPWTGGAFELGSAIDAHRFIAPQANHEASIDDLAPADREQVLDRLAHWTGVAPMPLVRPAPPRRAWPRHVYFMRGAPR